MEETAAFAERASVEMPAHGPRKTAVLSGKVDHVDHVGHVWGQETRADAIEQVAQVMRAGVRKTDFFAPSQDEGFTIVAEGASEIEASEIAKRLMEKLAKMPVPGVDEDLRLTASFGVAERREGEGDSELRARADAALDTARDTRAGQGEDCIVAASEWEEVHFLPAPSPSENGPSDEDAGQTGSSEAA